MDLRTRLWHFVGSQLNSILERPASPETQRELILQELTASLDSARCHAATAIAAERCLGWEVERHRKQAVHWGRMACAVLAAGSGDRAHRALERKHVHDSIVQRLAEEHATALRSSAAVQVALPVLETRWEACRCRQRVARPPLGPLAAASFDKAAAHFVFWERQLSEVDGQRSA